MHCVWCAHAVKRPRRVERARRMRGGALTVVYPPNSVTCGLRNLGVWKFRVFRPGGFGRYVGRSVFVLLRTCACPGFRGVTDSHADEISVRNSIGGVRALVGDEPREKFGRPKTNNTHVRSAVRYNSADRFAANRFGRQRTPPFIENRTR